MKVIAEVGSNWKSLDDCLMSIEQAKASGADAVKFQLFSPSEMYGSGQFPAFSTPYLDPSWVPVLATHSKDNDIEFMCTAFSTHGYDLVNLFVDTHKVASAEITDWNMLIKLNSFRKLVYLSTGGATYDQISAALFKLKDCPVTILYCVTAYPAKVIDFRHLIELRETFGAEYQYGYSDHSIDVLNIPAIAKRHGCSVIEKHVNFTAHTDTDDAPHSLNAAELSLLVKSVKGEDIPMGDTFTPCTWQRKLTDMGYYRPRAEIEI